MLTLDEYLKIDSCPHCLVDNPNVRQINAFDTSYDNGDEQKRWGIYVCKRCGGVIMAVTYPPNKEVEEIFPEPPTANEALPDKARSYLKEAMETIGKPSACIMVCASSIDAMLKDKGLVKGSLYDRIDGAVAAGLLTKEMGQWAHQIRLDANDQRHADLHAGLPTIDDAKRCVEFAKTLGEILFVLPARVTRGVTNTAPITPSSPSAKPKAVSVPKTIRLPPAYQGGYYCAPIKLENSKTKPTVTAKFYYSATQGPLPDSRQPEELIVENRPGNPKAWTTNLIIKPGLALPQNLYFEIIVDGIVKQNGTLTVTKQGQP